jgi:flagellum-specific peptidoglycan hydrolase FlgJ
MKEEFIQLIWNGIQDVNISGSHPSVIIAQAAVESNWGRSDLSIKYNNYFGIKAGSSWTGKIVNMQTGEVYNGKNVTVTSGFRVYDSLSESIQDRINLLKKHYQAALSAKTPEDEINALKAGGYATSTNYVSTIVDIINVNNLKKYDTMKYIKPTTTYSIFLVLGIAVVALSIFKLIKTK